MRLVHVCTHCVNLDFQCYACPVSETASSSSSCVPRLSDPEHARRLSIAYDDTGNSLIDNIYILARKIYIYIYIYIYRPMCHNTVTFRFAFLSIIRLTAKRLIMVLTSLKSSILDKRTDQHQLITRAPSRRPERQHARNNL